MRREPEHFVPHRGRRRLAQDLKRRRSKKPARLEVAQELAELRDLAATGDERDEGREDDQAEQPRGDRRSSRREFGVQLPTRAHPRISSAVIVVRAHRSSSISGWIVLGSILRAITAWPQTRKSTPAFLSD